MSDTPGGREKAGGSPIDQNNKVDCGNTAHDLVDCEKGNTNLDQNKSDISLVNTVKGLGKIQFKNKGTGVLDFY